MNICSLTHWHPLKPKWLTNACCVSLAHNMSINQFKFKFSYCRRFVTCVCLWHYYAVCRFCVSHVVEVSGMGYSDCTCLCSVTTNVTMAMSERLFGSWCPDSLFCWTFVWLALRDLCELCTKDTHSLTNTHTSTRDKLLQFAKTESC